MQRHSTVLRLIISLIVLAALLVSCAPPAVVETTEEPTKEVAPTQAVVMKETATQAPTLPPPAKYKEAPELAALVASGELPPVEERLPENPKVVPPNEEIGVYGGTLHRLTKPSADGAHFTRTVVYENLVRWTTDWTGIEPNLAESYEVNEDATVYTFHLRKGVKWSDGTPYTSKDIMFWYEDVALNTDISPTPPSWLKDANGDPAKVEAPDDFTVIFTFGTPNGLFLSRLCTPDTLDIVRIPAHWAKQYHVKYAAQEDIDRMVKEGQYETWKDLYVAKVQGDAIF